MEKNNTSSHSLTTFSETNPENSAPTAVLQNHPSNTSIRNTSSKNMYQHVPQHHITTVNLIAGAVSGLSVSIIFAPLDVVKTRMIVQRRPKHLDASHFKGVVGTMVEMYNKEGIKSLYRGLGTTMIGYIPNWAIYFASYQIFREQFHTLSSTINDSQTKEIGINFVSSILAGALTSVATSPVWVVKTRLQTQVTANDSQQQGKYYRNTLDAFSKIYQQEGFKAFYRGLVPSLFGLIHVGVQFPLYEYLKWKIKEKEGHQQIGFEELFVASFVSKILASVIAYPHEVLRSRMQDHAHGSQLQVQGVQVNPYRDVRHAIQTIFKEEGIPGFYRGIVPNLFRTVPAAMITLMSYEFSARYLQKWDERLAEQKEHKKAGL